MAADKAAHAIRSMHDKNGDIYGKYERGMYLWALSIVEQYEREHNATNATEPLYTEDTLPFGPL